ncbi:maternal embryonic leucine zipper kinase [Colletotrichum liriopes]|uniref:Maternal embryonic leucine zipper kinase n=1 Tax=Colletotrichum liriopes TaxID=708192 RepID=A0AA37GN93_9PEZI|nr:maternal embryonic leucine zipper kinase [Colletotrichum liriopes]
MEDQDRRSIIYGSSETISASSELIAKTYHSVITTCNWNHSLAVIKRFNHHDNPRTFQRWRDEVNALSLAGAHENLTRIFASDPKTLAITLRHEPGRSLDLYIDSANNSTLSLSDSHVIWKQTADALAFLHSKHIIHDDVKPDNIVFSPVPQPRAVLIDFGAALTNPSTLPLNGWTPSGTPPYAPPEFFQKRKDYAGDVWGLGVTMLFCFGHTSLPAGDWILPHVFEDEGVKSDMVAWLDEVERLRKTILEGSNQLLAEMLHSDPCLRIKSDELSERLRV